MVTQTHRTTGDGYSVAVWHVDDHYVIQATADAFIPSRLLRPSAVRSSYADAMELAYEWSANYRREAAKSRVEATLARGIAVVGGTF